MCHNEDKLKVSFRNIAVLWCPLVTAFFLLFPVDVALDIVTNHSTNLLQVSTISKTKYWRTVFGVTLGLNMRFKSGKLALALFSVW
eukprot:CAMPEP_0113939814 /NCGR_PEP_ID=MMETSP1339-20121228/6066_1 /TAXON_ID=94617 /ORGANISM="Fibrocapsa japonica" /LENGTH=85 /DNA_ID=CAMNT_0000943429 /DNA_START=300 /DNA_END=554 /DNA_ORIENTATION=+ /assembly_acc=CAM_ASM_000762